MGMNAYFTYSVVGFYGSGSISFSSAITAVLLEGVIVLILSLTGVRYFIIKLVPEPVRVSTPAAIGAFLAHLGLQSAEGIGVVVSDLATAVTLGGCPVQKQTPIVAYNELCATQGICIPSGAFTCDDMGGQMTSGTTWMGILGMAIIAIMLVYKNRSAFICGIALVTIVSWFRDTAVSFFPDTDEGDARFDYFKQVARVEPLSKLLVNYSGDLKEVVVALITFLYVDFLDTSVCGIVQPFFG
jgi:adenine/guanine/hypoxanthine permease